MTPPTENEAAFKKEVEALMSKYGVSFRVVISPVGRLSKIIHFLTKSFYTLNSSVIIHGARQPDTNN